MVNIGAVEEVLGDLKKNPEVKEATVVSRSGMHIAGSVPKSSHLETYVAMNAIMLGAGESLSSELDDNMQYVYVAFKHSILVVLAAGAKALVVIELTQEASITSIIDILEAARSRIEKYMS